MDRYQRISWLRRWIDVDASDATLLHTKNKPPQCLQDSYHFPFIRCRSTHSLSIREYRNVNDQKFG